MKIVDLNSRGQGVARPESSPVVFVDRALPEEVVETVLYREEKRWAAAWPTQIITPASERREPDCPHYETCGGCAWRHVSPENEVSFKERAILRQAKRTGLDLPPPDLSVVLPRDGSRQRVRLQVRDGRPCLIGPPPDFAPFPLLQQPPCPALDPAIARWLAQTGPLDDGELRLAVSGEGICHSDREEVRVAPLPWFGFEVYNRPDYFFQPSLTGAKAIAGTLRHWLEGRRFKNALDLYGGQGLWLLALADRIEQGTVLESDPATRKDFLNNDIGDALAWQRMDLERETIAIPKGALLIMDPPRSGVSRKLRKQLPTCDAHTLIQISCYADTLIRDAALLQEGGWQATHMRFVHQYPGTTHVETLLMWERQP